jgi:tetratricopeptide (TPR) repeat protein
VPAYVESLAGHLDYGWSPLVGLRTEQWKYIRAPRPELYDLRKDPAETRNLADASPEIVRRLDASLETLLERGERRRHLAQSVVLDTADRARLESLGYVVPERPLPGPRPDRAGGPDPKDEIGLLARIATAQIRSQHGSFAEGLALLRDIETPPPHLSVLRAAIAFNAGDYALAESDAARAIAAMPLRLDAQILYGRALEARGNAASARLAFERAVSLAPRSIEAWRGVERAATAVGDETGAESARDHVDALSDAERDAPARPGLAEGERSPKD